MYGQTEDQDKQKKKIIIVSLVMGIIIIVLIGVLISAITSKNKAKLAEGKEQETAVIREDEKQEPTKVEETKKAEDEKLEPVANDPKTDTKTVTPSSESKDLPSTGPGSVLGLALLAGSATTYAFSKKRF
ncbi:hypothetical protein IKE86_01395 [Candidatus Saccharibacteria bacterium]|nr:hypothetical protein [Candidatus Saccharibacteria bacterium]